MKRKSLVTSIARFALVLVAGFVGVGSVSADDARNGQLHIQKDCIGFAGEAGGHCTITRSSFPKIPAGSRIFYDQAVGVPAGMLDSNIVLDAGGGNRAVGRCTLDLSTGLGLCTLSDGTGQLAGFTARVDVSYVGGTLWALNGTYSFNPLPPR